MTSFKLATRMKAGQVVMDPISYRRRPRASFSR
jgi:hypothetical protein